MRNIKIAALQFSCCSQVQENIDKAETLVREAASNGANLILLPELFERPYFCQEKRYDYYDYALPLTENPAVRRFQAVAGELGVVIPVSFYERDVQRLFNSIAMIDADGSILGVYRKTHIPDDHFYQEKFYFTPGDIGFEPIQTSLGKLGVLVCWDQWYPEAARLMALKGAELLIYPTAIGWESSDTDDEKARQLNAWIISQRAHAVANGLPVISVNRVGHEPDPSGQTNGILFWGNSFVAGPQGEFLAQAGNDHPENMVVEIDMERSENVRRWWPFLRDRRIDEYEGLTKRFLD